MLLTRESDYALRVLRSLQGAGRKSVGEISREERIPQQFAYKIIKKLSRAGLLDITRGVDGGCCLKTDLSQVSLFDLLEITEEGWGVNACMEEGYACARRAEMGGCTVHDQLRALQEKMYQSLRSYSLEELLRKRDETAGEDEESESTDD